MRFTDNRYYTGIFEEVMSFRYRSVWFWWSRTSGSVKAVYLATFMRNYIQPLGTPLTDIEKRNTTKGGDWFNAWHQEAPAGNKFSEEGLPIEVRDFIARRLYTVSGILRTHSPLWKYHPFHCIQESEETGWDSNIECVRSIRDIVLGKLFSYPNDFVRFKKISSNTVIANSARPKRAKTAQKL